MAVNDNIDWGFVNQLAVHDWAGCTCGPYWSVIPPGPCPIHDPQTFQACGYCGCHCRHHVKPALTFASSDTWWANLPIGSED